MVAEKIKIKIEVVTGLRIGGEKETFEIGGLDNPVIKTVIVGNDEYKDKRIPIIPGSSLKGRLRHIIEEQLGIVSKLREMINNKIDINKVKDGIISTDETLESITKNLPDNESKNFEKNVKTIWEMFGKAGKAEGTSKATGKLIFTDLYPTENTLKMWKELEERELTFDFGTELKIENVINRITGTSSNVRKMERVIPGSQFEGYIIFLRDKDNELTEKEKEMLKLLVKGLYELQENYYLGGSGSRGYGRVKIYLNDKEVAELVKDENKIVEKLLAHDNKAN